MIDRILRVDLYEYKERERGRYLSREIFVDSISVGEFDEVGLRHTRSAQRFTEVSSPLSQCSLFSRLLFQAEVFGVWRLSQRWSLCSPPPPQCRTARVCVVAACVCVSRSLAAPINPASLCHYTLALSRFLLVFAPSPSASLRVPLSRAFVLH